MVKVLHNPSKDTARLAALRNMGNIISALREGKRVIITTPDVMWTPDGSPLYESVLAMCKIIGFEPHQTLKNAGHLKTAYWDNGATLSDYWACVCGGAGFAELAKDLADLIVTEE